MTKVISSYINYETRKNGSTTSKKLRHQIMDIFNEDIFTTHDVRGLLNIEIKEDDAFYLGISFGYFLNQKRTIVKKLFGFLIGERSNFIKLFIIFFQLRGSHSIKIFQILISLFILLR